MNNWVELKQWAENQKMTEVTQKMNELEQLDYFIGYTDQDGYELIEAKADEGVAVWTHVQSNNKYKVKVMKSAVIFYDEEDRFYDCDINGIEIIETLE
ncbi:hypothetical protein [Paenibacillus silvae]|uniref:Uncharacterized protein n=1 Tax=Paenibacillus silvae TaxID=1325358 RepID=A0A2W6NNG0_9BACL|nr:hypothetical protein [Paenibacillus silvae]PZT57377.1 hypothetical protein DN757_01595 [Paenibacillus silvae]